MKDETPTIMPLDQALAYAQVCHLPLVYDDRTGVEIWTCGRKQPMSLRRSVFKHRRQLLDRMQSGDHLCCPSPALHRRWWAYAGGQRYTCQMCLQLEPYMHCA